MDLVKFFSVSVTGLPLILVVMGLVTWVSKTFALTGRSQLVASMAIGLILGGGYQASQAIPADFAGWFALAIYGLALGLVASGVYDTGKQLAGRRK